MANNDEIVSSTPLHNGVRQTRSDVCWSNNLPGYYIKRDERVLYIIRNYTHTHTYTSLNYQEIPRSLARELFVALSARRLHRDKNFCLVYLCLPTSAATNEKEKRYRGGNSFFEIRATFARQGKAKKKEKKIRSDESIPSTQCFLPSNEKRISHTRQTSYAYFYFKYRHRDFRCTDKIRKDMRNWNFQQDFLNFYSISPFEFTRIR